MSNRKRLVTICSIALVMLVAVGATLAYFWDIGEASNKFTTAGSDPTSGVEVTITEPGWTDDNGDKMFPGDVARKDPYIHNIKGESYGRIAVLLYDTTDPKNPTLITDADRAAKIMKLTFFDESKFDASGKAEKMDSATLAALKRFNDAVFAEVTGHSFGNGVFVFDHIGKMTANEKALLFSGFAIPTDYTQDDVKELGNFNMDIVGLAVQTKNLTEAEGKAELDKLLKGRIDGTLSTPAPSTAPTATPSASPTQTP